MWIPGAPFVCLFFGENPPSLDDCFQEIDRAALDPFSEMLHVKRVVYDLHCNWKVFVDNYLDNGYHVPHLHPGLSDHLELSTYKAKIGKNVSVQNCRSRSPEKGKEAAESRVGSQVNYFWVYPNFMINRYGKWMDTNLVIPVSETRCLTIFDYFCEERPQEKELIANLEASDRVQQEDIDISQRVQRGLESGVYLRGPYAPRFEKTHVSFPLSSCRGFQHLSRPFPDCLDSLQDKIYARTNPVLCQNFKTLHQFALERVGRLFCGLFLRHLSRAGVLCVASRGGDD